MELFASLPPNECLSFFFLPNELSSAGHETGLSTRSVRTPVDGANKNIRFRLLPRLFILPFAISISVHAFSQASKVHSIINTAEYKPRPFILLVY